MKKISKRYCKKCQKETTHEETAPNHVLHLVMSVVTCGAWLLIWLLLAITAQPAQCQECGKVYSGAVDKVMYGIIFAVFAFIMLWLVSV